MEADFLDENQHLMFNVDLFKFILGRFEKKIRKVIEAYIPQKQITG